MSRTSRIQGAHSGRRTSRSRASKASRELDVVLHPAGVDLALEAPVDHGPVHADVVQGVDQPRRREPVGVGPRPRLLPAPVDDRVASPSMTSVVWPAFNGNSQPGRRPPSEKLVGARPSHSSTRSGGNRTTRVPSSTWAPARSGAAGRGRCPRARPYRPAPAAYARAPGRARRRTGPAAASSSHRLSGHGPPSAFAAG